MSGILANESNTILHFRQCFRHSGEICGFQEIVRWAGKKLKILEIVD